MNRGVGGPEGRRRHGGVDLSNQRDGDEVRAAAHGLVLRADARGWNGGFGHHVVIAHRLRDGEIAYTVYAHLAPKSLRVRAGQRVAAGAAVGRVGRTGRASAPHLHFEIRLPGHPDEPWQRARVVDPLAFVAARLAPERDADDPAAAYLAWAESGALVAPGRTAGAAISRREWWAMLARAAAHDLARPPVTAAGLRDSLVAAGVLPDGAPADPDGAPGWTEMADDAARLAAGGVRLAPPVLVPADHGGRCAAVLGEREPARAVAGLEARAATPTLEAACLLLATAAGLAPAP